MPIVSRTRNQLRQDLAMALNDLVFTNGSAYAPVNATLLSDNILTMQRVDALKGFWLYLFSGGGSPQERQIWGNTIYTPAGSLASVQVLQPMSPVPSTNTGWEVHRVWSPAQKHLAINRAIRRGDRLMLTRMEDYANVANSVLLNGAFHRWPDGATSVPGSWTASGTGTIARSTNRYQGVYSAALTNTVSNAYSIYQDVSDYARFSGATFSAKALCHVNTADRVRLQVTDGVNTFNSSYHDGTGFDEEGNLEINNQTLAENLTRLRMDLRIETGTSITATFFKVWLQVGGVVYEYELPSLGRLTDVWIEGQQDGVFDTRIPRRWWDVNREVSPRRLIFAKHVRGDRAWNPVTGKVLKIVGQAYPPQLTADGDSVAIDAEYVLTRAAVDLLEQLPAEQRRSYADYDRWLRNAEQMELRSMTQFDPDSVEIEPH